MKKKLNLNAKPFNPIQVKEEIQENKERKEIPTIQEKEEQKDMGFWNMTFKERQRQLREELEMKKKQEIEMQQLKEQRLLEQQKRTEKFAKLKQKQLRRKDPLGIKRIHEIIKDLRIHLNKQEEKKKKKQFKFEIDDELNVNIVEKVKNKKPSKIQKAKQMYQEQQDPDYETVQESEVENDNNVNQLLNILEQMKNNNPICQQLHNSMKIRCWVQMIPCKEIDDLILLFVNSLSLKQAKKKVYEPKKYKKRIAAGFRECTRTLCSNLLENQAKLIILPINVIECPLKNGTDHNVLQILKLCQQRNTPVIHGSNRSKLGRAFCGKFGPKISIISIINYENMEENFNQLMELKNRQEQLYSAQFKQQLNLNQYLIQLNDIKQI